MIAVPDVQVKIISNRFTDELEKELTEFFSTVSQTYNLINTKVVYGDDLYTVFIFYSYER